MTEDIISVKVSLNIEDFDPDSYVNGVAVQAIALAMDPDEESRIVVQASNFDASPEGAQRVAMMLEVTAQAIRDELGGDQLQHKPKRPRFNPQPAGPKQGGK